MSRLRELRERQATILTNARAKFDEIKPDTAEARAKEIEAEFDRMMAEHDQIGQNIAREERLAAAQRSAEEARNAPDPRRPTHDGRAPGADDGQPVSYRQAFYEYVRAGADVGEMRPEARAALRAGVTEQRIQSTSGTAGGYTVPTELLNQIDIAMKAWGPMYSDDLCTVLRTASGNTINLPTVDDTAVAAVAHTEGTALTDDGGSDVTFGNAAIGAYAFDTEFVRFSMELAQDSIFNFETLLGQLLGERLARIANSKLTTGSGSSDVKGIVTFSAAGKTTAAAAAVTADEVVDFVHSVDPAYRASPKARMMFNDATLLALRKLKDSENRYLVQNAPDGSGMLVVGSVTVPYVINQAMASMAANAKFAVFGDFSRFYVRKVGNPIIGVMRERFWPDLGMAGLIRFDGEGSHSDAIKHMKNAAS
jgi:HK97 family phage major capsid protein